MKEFIYNGNFAGVELHYAFRHSMTGVYFRNWLNPIDTKKEHSLESRFIRIPSEDRMLWSLESEVPDNAYTEYGLSVYRTSDALLEKRCCVIHSAAMLWNKKVWLFAADSGTGKSTQIKQWKELYLDGVQIINGDKPILRLELDGCITVHPSPWRGKEGWGDDTLFGELGGIILLKQGEENSIRSLQPIQCAARLFSLFFCTFEEEKTVYNLGKIEEAILRNVPVWELVNKGDLASVALTHDTICSELYSCDDGD